MDLKCSGVSHRVIVEPLYPCLVHRVCFNDRIQYPFLLRATLDLSHRPRRAGISARELSEFSLEVLEFQAN